MENCVIKNSKRPYHSTMGPLLDDFDSLSKRRKKLFDNINSHIDNLIQLLQDTEDKLRNHSANHINGTQDFKYNSLSSESNLNDSLQKSDSLNGLILKYESSDTGNETSSTDFNNEPAMCDCTKQSIRDLAYTVKSYDVYRSINKLIKEFNHHFNEMGKALLGTRGNENQEMISPVNLDEQLVCRMIGIHLLHYGMFEVYEQLKRESTKLWGENHKGSVGELMVQAYKTLHDLIGKIKSCNIDPVLEWTKMQSDCSNLHVQRFNEIMINLYKIRFLKELFEAEEESNTQIIDEVKKSGLTSLWKIHNDEIGKLVTQVILGENLPNDADFDELKNKTIKMFTKLFCETGILMKKPPNYDRKPLLSEQSHQSFAFNEEGNVIHEVTEVTESTEEQGSQVTDVVAFSWRPMLTDTKNVGGSNDKLKYKSWILALHGSKIKAATFRLPEDKGVRLREDWLNPVGLAGEKIKQPRMASKYLNSNSLEHGRRLNFIKNRVALNANVESPRSISRALLMKALNSQEPIPRQGLVMSDGGYSTFPYYLENQLCDEEVSSFGRFVDPEDWVSTRNERGTTVLIATGSEESEENLLGLSSMGRLIDNYSTTVTQTEENPTRSTPTFSLTVFAGPSIFRDSRVSSQLLEADIISQRLLNVSPGSRIRIRFPTRTEEALENAPRRRETTISPYEQISSEPSSQPEEEHTTTMERSSITLRDILRMIMRGLRTETQPAVLRFRGSHTHHNLEDTRTASQDTESPKDKTGTHKRLVRPKQETKVEPCVDSEYIKVHLPYESPLSVVICAGHVTFPYLLDVLKVLFKERCEVSSKVGMWLKSNQQLPVESDLGPAFHFHSYLTCAVSKDQTSSENLPIMLSCGHVICKICHDRLSGKRRKRQFKCPMCPTIVEPNQTMELYLDWNTTHNNCVC